MATSSSSLLFFGSRENNNNQTPTPPPPPSFQQPQLHLQYHSSTTIAPPSSLTAPPPKKKRSLPGAPSKYPDAEVIALSPKTLMATNRFICEVCNKGFQREQNLQLHRRGHNLPWKLKQKTNKDPVRKKVYLCPETSCVHHDPSRALGDLTGIKKHYFRKHGEKSLSVKNVLNVTPFNRIGKLILRLVVLESTVVIVAPYFPGIALGFVQNWRLYAISMSEPTKVFLKLLE